MMMMMTNIHVLSEIQTHSLSIQAIKAYVSDLAGTGTGNLYHIKEKHMTESFYGRSYVENDCNNSKKVYCNGVQTFSKCVQ
jgi:hypothetical protein